MSRRLLPSFVATFGIMFLVPFLTYAPLSMIAGLEPPSGVSPAQFMLAVVVMKVGVALGFVLLYPRTEQPSRRRWLTYAAIWWVMHTLVEIGQAIGPGYGWLEAIGGIVAEAIYFPLAAWTVERILTRSAAARA